MSTKPENARRDQAGRFKKGHSGNPAGKPKGTRHKATMAALELLEGEAEVLSRKAIDLALAGDTTALRLCLERLLPARKDMPVNLELPSPQGPGDVVRLLAALLKSVAAGDVAPSEAKTIAGLLDNYRKAVETEEMERRLRALEESMTGGAE